MYCFAHFCTICIKNNAILIHTASRYSKNIHINICEMLCYVYPQMLTLDSHLPRLICLNCRNELINAYNFKLKCEKTIIRLEKFVKLLKQNLNKSKENHLTYNNNLIHHIFFKAKQSDLISNMGDESSINFSIESDITDVSQQFSDNSLPSTKILNPEFESDESFDSFNSFSTNNENCSSSSELLELTEHLNQTKLSLETIESEIDIKDEFDVKMFDNVDDFEIETNKTDNKSKDIKFIENKTAIINNECDKCDMIKFKEEEEEEIIKSLHEEVTVKNELIDNNIKDINLNNNLDFTTKVETIDWIENDLQLEKQLNIVNLTLDLSNQEQQKSKDTNQGIKRKICSELENDAKKQKTNQTIDELNSNSKTIDVSFNPDFNLNPNNQTKTETSNKNKSNSIQLVQKTNEIVCINEQTKTNAYQGSSKTENCNKLNKNNNVSKTLIQTDNNCTTDLEMFELLELKVETVQKTNETVCIIEQTKTNAHQNLIEIENTEQSVKVESVQKTNENECSKIEQTKTTDCQNVNLESSDNKTNNCNKLNENDSVSNKILKETVEKCSNDFETADLSKECDEIKTVEKSNENNNHKLDKVERSSASKSDKRKKSQRKSKLSRRAYSKRCSRIKHSSRRSRTPSNDTQHPVRKTTKPSYVQQATTSKPSKPSKSSTSQHSQHLPIVQCKYCVTDCQSYTSLRVHILRNHRNKCYWCTTCLDLFWPYLDYMDHCKVHKHFKKTHKYDNYEHDYYDNNFIDNYQFTSFDSLKYTCNNCYQYYETFSKFKQHITRCNRYFYMINKT